MTKSIRRASVDGQLTCCPPNAEPYTPQVMDVSQAIFGERSCFDSSPTEALPEFVFSRFPADLYLQISGSLPDHLFLSLMARNAEKSIAVGSFDLDKIILGHTWFRAANAGDVLRRWNVGCSAGHTLSAREHLLALRNPLSLHGVISAELAPEFAPVE